MVIGLFAALVKYIRYRSNIERTLNMVFLEIKVPKKESKEDREVEGEQFSNQRDFKEICVGIMMQLYEALHSIYENRIEHFFIGQDFISLEYAVYDGLVHFFIVCPREISAVVEKQVFEENGQKN